MRRPALWSWPTWPLVCQGSTCAQQSTQPAPRAASSTWRSSHVRSTNNTCIMRLRLKESNVYAVIWLWFVSCHSDQCGDDCRGCSGLCGWLHLPASPLCVFPVEKATRPRRRHGQWDQVSQRTLFYSPQFLPFLKGIQYYDTEVIQYNVCRCLN